MIKLHQISNYGALAVLAGVAIVSATVALALIAVVIVASPLSL